MNVKEIIDLARTNTYTTESQVSNTTATTWLNIIRKELWKEIITNVDENYGYNTWYLEQKTAQSFYDFPTTDSSGATTSIENIIQVNVKMNSTDTNYTPAREVKESDLAYSWDWFVDNQSQSDPIFTIQNNQLSIAPAFPSYASGTATAGASTSITLSSDASATTDYYKDYYIYIKTGTGSGQTRLISAYNGTTKVATVATWTTNPNATSEYEIGGLFSNTQIQIKGYESIIDMVVPNVGTATEYAAGTITLASAASTYDDYYNGAYVTITSATTGYGQTKQIADYVGSTKVATLASNWTLPTGTVTYVVTNNSDQLKIDPDYQQVLAERMEEIILRSRGKFNESNNVHSLNKEKTIAMYQGLSDRHKHNLKATLPDDSLYE